MAAPPFAADAFARIEAAGHAPFWIDPSGVRSHAELRDQIARFCGLFDRQGLEQGAVVLIAVGCDWTAATAFLAAVMDGKVPVVLSPEAGAGRIAGISARTSPALTLADPDRAAEGWSVKALLAGPDAQDAVDWDRGQRILAEECARATPRPPHGNAAACDTGYLLFTSGTTQAPKGVILSQGNLAGQLADIARVLGIGPGDRIMNQLVLAHTDGLIQGPVLAAWTGAAVIRPGRFDVTRLDAQLDLMWTHGASHVITVPTILSMLDRLEIPEDSFRRAGSRVIVSTAAPLSPALWDRIEARFGVPVVNEYGMTETVAASHFAGPFAEMGARHSFGRPVGCEAELRDETGTPVARGEVGELHLRGYQIFQGYYGEPERTAAALRDGWFATGDYAVELPDGSHALRGRRATAVNTGGFLVLPEEIDEALTAHPAVVDACTVGLDHPEHGEILVTGVVLRMPAEETALVQHCRASLEPWKVPRRIVPLEALQRSGSGKLEREKIRAALGAALSLPGPDRAPAEIVRTLAAQVFAAEEAGLTEATTPDDVPGWDSFAHMSLMLEVERALGISLSPREILMIDRLGDLFALAERKKA